jgi:hypothetical protein
MARPSKQQEMRIWLKGLLAAGRRKAEDVLAAAKQAGYSERSLRSVKAELEIVSEQENEIWYWRDPAIEQTKPASADKIDVLTHKVDELTRLSQPAVPVAVEPKSSLLTFKRSKAYDPNDPENKAVAEQYAREQARFKLIEGVVTSADPFGLLESANEDEIDRMMLLVREHLADLETRSKGKLKYRKAWEVTKQFEKEVTTKEWSTKQGKWIDVPAVQTETTVYISDVPVEGAKPVDVPDGYDSEEDVTFEAGKLETWIDRAKERQRGFLKPDSVAAQA